MKQEDTYMDQLIIDYLNGRLDELQTKELEVWVGSDIANKKYYYKQVEIWLAVEAALGSSESKDAAYRRFAQRIERTETKAETKTWRIPTKMARYVASIIIFTSLLGGSFYLGSNYDREAEETLQSVEVPLGSRTRIVLQDGSTVWLNAGSKLTYSSKFLSDHRDVQLEGEAYFEVTSNEDRPFKVNVSGVEVKVIGTKFNVKAYNDDDDISVALSEGKVEFTKDSDPHTHLDIETEQLLVYNKQSEQVGITTVDASVINQWIDGSHFFNEQSLIEITHTLEKSFDVRFIFRDHHKGDLIFYADFRGDETLTDILDILSSSKKFRYKKKHNIIEIY